MDRAAHLRERREVQVSQGQAEPSVSLCPCATSPMAQSLLLRLGPSQAGALGWRLLVPHPGEGSGGARSQFRHGTGPIAASS